MKFVPPIMCLNELIGNDTTFVIYTFVIIILLLCNILVIMH